MMCRSVSVGLTVVTLMSLGTLLACNYEPCLGTYMGAQVSSALLDISLTTGSLKLLNGSEDPKLKRLLEFRLATAIHSARDAIGHGPVMEPVSLPNLVPNWKNTIQRARAYVAEHHLDDSASLKEMDRNLRPLSDLGVIDAWLAKQPDGSRSQR